MKNLSQAAHKIRVLFLVPYPTEGASNRIRVEQFMPILRSRGVICRVRPFVNRPFYKILYLPHRYAKKAFWFLICTINRLWDIFRALDYDVIFVHREAYPFGGPFLETILNWMGKPIVFDFDDAIFLPNTSEHNISIERLKSPYKTARIIRMSKAVIAGNLYLKNYASRYNDKVVIVPSSIDTARFAPRAPEVPRTGICIGWIGSNTTRLFLYDLEDVFVKLSSRYKGLTIKIIGAPFYSSKLKNIVNVEWSLAGEIGDMLTFDIGIMPMPDNEWTKGKCGFKALLYMALGIPVIASDVGVNKEIIEDGVNGFLAGDEQDWFDKISILIEDGRRRSSMAGKGRETVAKRYSLDYTSPLFYKVLTDVYNDRYS